MQIYVWRECAILVAEMAVLTVEVVEAEVAVFSMVAEVAVLVADSYR